MINIKLNLIFLFSAIFSAAITCFLFRDINFILKTCLCMMFFFMISIPLEWIFGAKVEDPDEPEDMEETQISKKLE